MFFSARHSFSFHSHDRRLCPTVGSSFVPPTVDRNVIEKKKVYRMKKQLRIAVLALAMLLPLTMNGQNNNDGHASSQRKSITFPASDIQYWVGTGSNSAVVIIGWDDNPSGNNFALAWGVRWNGSCTAANMLDTIATYDTRTNYPGINAGWMTGFHYNDGTLVSGSSASYWCYTINGGYAGAYGSQDMTNGDVMEISSSCMFTLTTATAATNPNPVSTDPVDATIAFGDILYWVGSGSDSAAFIVNYAQPDTAFAWGYLFNGTTTAEAMVNAIAAADPRFEVVGTPSNGGDLHFVLDNGDTLGLSPIDPARDYNFWWTNLNGVSAGAGAATTLHNGDVFKYGDLNSAIDWDYQYGYYMEEAWTKTPTPVSVPDTTGDTPDPVVPTPPQPGSFCGAAGTPGSSAIAADSSAFVAWATGVTVTRGPRKISDPSLGVAATGTESNAVGQATLNNVYDVVSLGDGGTALVTFANPIRNGEGPDFAVFENGFSDNSLELAFVEVSSDGVRFVRFPATCLTQNTTQLGNAGQTDPTNLNNLAGKYRIGYGTPFDLDELSDSTGIDIDSIVYVRIVDVVGCIDPQYATRDQYGNIINDPWPTPFESSGYDLTGVGVIHELTPGVGIDEAVAVVDNIYPNPTTGRITVSTRRAAEAALYDLSGRQVAVYALAEGKNSLDLTTFQNGVYMLRVEGSVSKVVKR